MKLQGFVFIFFVCFFCDFCFIVDRLISAFTPLFHASWCKVAELHKTQEMSVTAMKCVLRVCCTSLETWSDWSGAFKSKRKTALQSRILWCFFQELAQTFDKKNQQLTAENQKLANSVYLSEWILDLSSWRLPFQTEVKAFFGGYLAAGFVCCWHLPPRLQEKLRTREDDRQALLRELVLSRTPCLEKHGSHGRLQFQLDLKETVRRKSKY